MFAFKKKYLLIIESIKDISLKNIKKRNKFIIIYRNNKYLKEEKALLKFRKNCKIKAIAFYVANDLDLAINLNSDGVYLSSYNKSFKALTLVRSDFSIIGSAHSQREIAMKIKQGCSLILLSKLFLVKYNQKARFLGVVKFNNFLKLNKNLIPLGGINLNNLNHLNNIASIGLALKSEIKKKPANIINRLF